MFKRIKMFFKYYRVYRSSGFSKLMSIKLSSITTEVPIAEPNPLD